MVAAGRPGHQRWRAIRIVGGLLPSNVSFRFTDYPPTRKFVNSSALLARYRCEEHSQRDCKNFKCENCGGIENSVTGFYVDFAAGESDSWTQRSSFASDYSNGCGETISYPWLR
jgi:hypothetical protein